MQRQNSFYTRVPEYKAVWLFALTVFFLCIGYYLLGLHNQRAQMADFRVYYDAAGRLVESQKVYGEAFGVGSGFFKYSPLAGWLFVPFRVFSFEIASFIYYLLVAIALVWSLLHWIFVFTEKKEISRNKILLALALTTLFMADHAERELHLGNVNVFLLIACWWVFHWLDIRPWQSGVIYALILLFKPHFLILAPYLLWKKKYKTIIATVSGVVVGLFFPAIFCGWDKNLQLLSEWLRAIQEHNVALYESPNTVYGIIHRLVPAWPSGSFLIAAVLVVAALLFLFFTIKNNKVYGKEKAHIIEFFLLIALIPNLVHTDTEHFMWTWPLVAFCLVTVIYEVFRLRWFCAAMLCVAFIPYCLNSPDIVGKYWQQVFDMKGLLGAANLLIIFTAIVIHKSIGRVSANL